jgi:hypothetical protein
MGFIAYYTVVSNQAMETFMFIGLGVAILNILFKLLLIILKTESSFFGFDKNLLGSLRSKYVDLYFIIIILFSIVYIAFFIEELPLFQLVLSGELGERLDATGNIPFYITVSSILMICIPSAFLYFKEFHNRKVVNILLFFYVIIVLTIGGNKGIVSFFILFYILFSFRKLAIWKGVLAFFSVISIYAISKGITSLSDSGLAYLSESPLRRLFATQGVGFIGRIKMVNENKFNLDSDFNIKQQLYSEMYRMPLGTGSGPTHFMGDLYVEYGPLLMTIVYVVYLILILFLLRIVYLNLDYKKHSVILWNVFILIYISTMSDISVANILRSSIVFINIFFIFRLSKY